jgi:chemotaxis protein methyltransferase CheR
MRTSYVAPDEGLARIALLITRHTGIELGAEALTSLERKLQKQIGVLKVGTLVEYARVLEGLPEGHPDIQHAIEQATIKETYFWREDLQVAAWMDEVFGVAPTGYATTRKRETLPRDLPPRFSIWSAGCATGEEIYTIAMMLEEVKLLERIQFRLVGTDVSRKAIETARRATYGASSFRAMPASIRARYFIETDEGTVVRDELRELCRFQVSNMVADGAALFGQVNAIFCRNVLIYFGEVARRKALERFHEALAPGGILCLGHSESLLHMKTPFEPLATSAGILYVKRGAGRTKR